MDPERIARKAGCDPRTVRKYLLGERVQRMVAARIARAMKALKLSAPSDAIRAAS